MFNRANKMTALLVAAAAVVSLVPATGVNAADVERIESKDGKVYNAVAYKDGHAYIDGDEISNKDEGVYYLSGGKYSELDKVDTDSDVEVYGEKYVNVDDADYFVDLTNGKVTDDDVKEDDIDEVAGKLRKNLKDDTDDRYEEKNASSYREDAKENKAGIDTIKSIPGNKFGETWYTTEVSPAKTEEYDKVNEGQNFNIFTDAKGNYIDADYNLGKIKVESTSGDSVKIENTNDKEDIGKVDDAISASVKQNAILGQDSKNIYRTATITIKAEDGVLISEVYGIKVGKEEKKDGKPEVVNNGAFRCDGLTKDKDNDNKIGAEEVHFDVIQKISKQKASHDVDGANYAKDVTSYVISKDNGEEVSEKSLIYKDNKDVKYTVAKGKVIAYLTYEDDKKDKVKTETITLDKDHNLYYTDIADQADEEVKKNDKCALDIDVDGNLWRLDGGYIYKWDNDEDWDKVYKVDGSMTELSVYDKNNMIVWDENDEVYSIIGNKEDKKDKEEDNKVEVKAGWAQGTDGTWSFVNADGTKKTGWFQDGANWYLANEAGIMQTGWKTVGGTWYYLNESGAMQTGWKNLGGTWYYLNNSGAMQTGWVIVSGNWYFLQPSGAMKTGWYNDNGTWYCLDASGKMLANTTVNGYTLGANGAWVK
ncbi:N-acetylmuramoyl-L-alanine amidase family protein [Clostridium taeniosporum]|uniref:Cell wall-binding protein n=1 Tax=Clostridium taeniosporum TaxID=394958 RepID=A0A1D7XMN4_9CLOT|nr:N-acetylmuramoyl-L-alanine amidase family protein [Clostridium taeniosporum]AOR24574.1 cell wall-binding protein [Clostridium taeniosporum]